jgi:hypothetical protein
MRRTVGLPPAFDPLINASRSRTWAQHAMGGGKGNIAYTMLTVSVLPWTSCFSCSCYLRRAK